MSAKTPSGHPELAKPAFAATFPPTPHGLPIQWIRPVGVLVLLSLILQHGFPITATLAQWLNWLDVLLAVCFCADLLLPLFRKRVRKQAMAARRFEYLLLAPLVTFLALGWFLPPGAVGGLLRALDLESVEALFFSLIKLYLLLSLCVQLLRAIQRLFGKGVRPEIILAGSFAILILIGTFLLLLPNASAKDDAPIGPVDAFFTAVSAVCVTGLGVRDTGADFSPFGQTIILVLFQTGGLGIITFVAFLSIFSTRTLPVPQMVAFRQIVNAPTMSDLKRQIVGILVATGLIELIGVILLYQCLPMGADTLARIRWSVFHSVSAFCNAGFALQSDNVIPFQSNAGMIFTLMALIVLGGLGFLVIPELAGYRLTRTPLFRRLRFFRRQPAGQAPNRVSIQTKLSIRVTLLLLAAGLIGFWILEFNHILRNRSLGDSFLISAFQSVVPRTAGFNSVPIDELQDTTLLFLMMLMVIGASPVSMGGGIKTVSFGILLLALRSLITRRERVEAFGRTIPMNTLYAALSVFFLYMLAASFGIFLLALFDPEMRLQDQAFEMISALSTVGLSTGITASLSLPSKLVICLAMFVGRVGPISLVLAVVQSQRTVAYELPEEQVVVG